MRHYSCMAWWNNVLITLMMQLACNRRFHTLLTCYQIYTSCMAQLHTNIHDVSRILDNNKNYIKEICEQMQWHSMSKRNHTTKYANTHWNKKQNNDPAKSAPFSMKVKCWQQDRFSRDPVKEQEKVKGSCLRHDDVRTLQSLPSFITT